MNSWYHKLIIPAPPSNGTYKLSSYMNVQVYNYAIVNQTA